MDINNLVKEAVNLNASDIHLSIDNFIKFRINGDLINFSNHLITKEYIDKILNQLFNDEHSGYLQKIEFENIEKQNNNYLKKKLEQNEEIDFSKDIQNIRLRGNIYKQNGNINISIRIIENKIFSFEQLRLKKELEKLCQIQNGLILITGVTGSGKSTTLTSIIDYINETQKKHIITIEDPIEYIHKSKNSLITQRQINTDTKNYNSALKSILRQDPDIILIGEMRDNETIEFALKCAETGHLVLSTLHTMGAPKSIDRIISSFENEKQNQIRMQLSTTLQGVISQRLIKTNDNKRVLGSEVMIVNSAIRNLIRENKIYQIQNIIQTNSKNYMRSFDNDLINLYRENIISKEELIKNCIDINFIKSLI